MFFYHKKLLMLCVIFGCDISLGNTFGGEILLGKRFLFFFHLTDTAMLISELTRFDSFYIFSTELLVFLLCRQTDKEFRLPWPSFVRVEIYYRYRLSINRKYILYDSWISHSEVVRASASQLRGHEFESQTIHFPYQGFFLFPCLSFFSQFRSKTLWEFILKVRQSDLHWKRSQAFLFFQNC